MGCDIHIVWQAQNNNGMWVDIHDAPMSMCRNYDVFGVLAGVRGDKAPISEPRGLPDDFKFLDKDSWIGDYGFSWLTVGEILDYDWSIVEFTDEIPKQVTAAIEAAKAQLDTDNPAVRLVFGFDS